MFDFSDTLAGPTACSRCGGTRSRGQGWYVWAEASHEIFCSEACLRAAVREHKKNLWAARRRTARRLGIGAVWVGAFLAPHFGPPDPPRVEQAPPPQSADDAGPIWLPLGWYGPAWPPTETSLLAALGRDAWVHPLAGPVRRMPRTDARVFGASRPGNRAVECRNGHCGVDLGGEIWGEHVHAVHDGVVDFVQRGPNADHGGSFVRLAHRNGTIFTQYFHLAAIPRRLERGVPVKGGDVVGLLGDSGVKESAPHLHFSISIRPVKDGPEKYFDPEPLIALWPLRVPIDGSEVALVTTLSQPGVPLGSAPPRSLMASAKRKGGKQKGEVDDAAAGKRSRGSRKTEESSDDDSASDSAAPDPGEEGPTPERAPESVTDE